MSQITKREGAACLREMRTLAECGVFFGYDNYDVVSKLDPYGTPYGNTMNYASTREEAAQHALLVLALCSTLSKVEHDL